jgi:hypothetical protein
MLCSIAPTRREGRAMALEVRSVDNLLGAGVPFAHAVKAGPWIFLTGHEAYDWQTGRVDEVVSGPPGFPLFGQHKSRREADFILQRMRGLLGEFGTDSRTASGSINTTQTHGPSPPIISPGMRLSATISRRARRSSWSAASVAGRRYRPR